MPLAPGRSSERAILVSSVMFFSLSSAMVIGHLRRIGIIRAGSKIVQGNSIKSRQEAGGLVVKQPAVVPQQNVPAQTEPSAAQSLRSDPAPRSWFPGYEY